MTYHHFGKRDYGVPDSAWPVHSDLASLLATALKFRIFGGGLYELLFLDQLDADQIKTHKRLKRTPFNQD